MSYKRDRSPYYYCRRRRLPGYGDTGRISSGVTSKRIARDMERLLEDLAQRALLNASWYDLLDAVCKERTITLPELLGAKSQGRLDALRRSLHDPLIRDAVAIYRENGRVTRETNAGLDQLVEAVPAGSRLSLLDGRTITELCRQAERKGRKRNSVRRIMLRAISLLLRYHLGKVERDRIFADVQFAAEDDTREVHLTPVEIGRLLAACDALSEAAAPEYRELRTIIHLALVTSADRGVLLAGRHMGRTHRGLRVRDLRIYKDQAAGADRYSGEVYLQDGKAAGRTRTVPLTDRLCRDLLALCRHKQPDDPVFALSYTALDRRWARVREAASLHHIRFKDLRAQTAIYGEETGIPQTVIQRTMGHSDEAMTRRYQQRAAALQSSQAEALEAAMLGAEGSATENTPDASKVKTSAPTQAPTTGNGHVRKSA